MTTKFVLTIALNERISNQESKQRNIAPESFLNLKCLFLSMVYYNINEELFRIIEIFDKLQEVHNIT